METQKKYETIPFEVEHLQVMDIRQEEEESLFTLEDVEDRFRCLKELSIDAKAFMYDGRIIFCAGYYEQWPGVIECWMVPSIHVQKAKLGFCRILKGYVDDIIGFHKCHRFQTTAPNDDLHARWMRFLGLEKEGTMRLYTHDQKDYCMYAKVV